MTQYGQPSDLNANNDCQYYIGINSIGKLARRILWGIPLKPTIEQKVNEKELYKSEV